MMDMFSCFEALPNFELGAPESFPTRVAGGALEPPRVAVLLTGTRGDHCPMVPTLKKMQDRGMQVVVFVKKSFATMFRSEGLETVTLPGADFEYIFTHDSVRAGLCKGPVVGSTAVEQLMDSAFDQFGVIEAIADGLTAFRPTVVLWHIGMPIEALVGCRLCQCPSICFAPVPFAQTEEFPCILALPSSGESGWFAKQSYRLTWQFAFPFVKRKLLSRIHETYGLLISGIDIFDMYNSERRPMLCAWSPLLGPRCKDYHAGVQEPIGFLRRSDADQRKSFRVPDGLNAFVEGKSRGKLAYISWGSMSCGSDDSLTHLAVKALQLAGADGVVQSGYADLRCDRIADPKLRTWAEKHVFFVERGASIQHNWLFPQCGVCVHHGGAGTVASCLYAGTTSIVTPVWGDQFHWARRVEASGVGLCGPPLCQATPEALALLLKEALADLAAGAGSMAAEAKALGETMQKEEDGVTRTVEFLEDFCRGAWGPCDTRRRAKADEWEVEVEDDPLGDDIPAGALPRLLGHTGDRRGGLWTPSVKTTQCL